MTTTLFNDSLSLQVLILSVLLRKHLAIRSLSQSPLPGQPSSRLHAHVAPMYPSWFSALVSLDLFTSLLGSPPCLFFLTQASHSSQPAEALPGLPLHQSEPTGGSAEAAIPWILLPGLWASDQGLHHHQIGHLGTWPTSTVMSYLGSGRPGSRSPVMLFTSFPGHSYLISHLRAPLTQPGKGKTHRNSC